MSKKYKVTVTPEDSEFLQKVAFKCGYEWLATGAKVQLTHHEHLIFDANTKRIAWVGSGKASDGQGNAYIPKTFDGMLRVLKGESAMSPTGYKVKVTPKLVDVSVHVKGGQSKTLQQAAFTAGITWRNRSKEIMFHSKDICINFRKDGMTWGFSPDEDMRVLSFNFAMAKLRGAEEDPTMFIDTDTGLPVVGYKVRVHSDTTSSLLQEAAFKAGYQWFAGQTTPSELDAPYLFFKMGRKTITCASSEDHFNQHEYKEIYFHELCGMFLKEAEDAKAVEDSNKFTTTFYAEPLGEAHPDSDSILKPNGYKISPWED